MWESDRGSRELEDWAGFLNDCRRHGVLIYVTRDDKTYNVAKVGDWTALANSGVNNATESDKKSEDIKRGVADAANRGVPYGKTPYGYRRSYEGSGPARVVHQEPDPDTGPVAREIITRISRSDPVSRIVQDLYDRKIPSPAGQPRWTQTTIVRLVLGGVVYIGKRRHNGGPLLAGSWPAIIDEDVYWRAVAVLSDPARRTNAGSGIRPGSAKYLLSYIVKCGTCDSPLSMTTHHSTVEAYYRCSTGRAGCVSAPMAWMDELVADSVIRWLAEPGRYEDFTRSDDGEAAAARDEAKAERDRLEDFRR